jgi:hypothetical protein
MVSSVQVPARSGVRESSHRSLPAPCFPVYFGFLTTVPVLACPPSLSWPVTSCKVPSGRRSVWLGYGSTLSACSSRGKHSSHSLPSCATLEIPLSHLTEGLETLQNFPVRHWSLFGNRSHACLLPLSPISAEQHQTVCIKSRMTAIVGKVSSCQMSISTAITIFAP